MESFRDASTVRVKDGRGPCVTRWRRSSSLQPNVSVLCSIYGREVLLTFSRGGLGLTGGIADVGSLVQCLQGIHEEKASLEILERYDEKRREVFSKFTDPLSSSNLERLFEDGATILDRDPALQYIKAASMDPIQSSQLPKVVFQVPSSTRSL